ncbi:TPA: PqqD family peptide modification chaperone [Staphylococcus aureus]|nr:PqqD family peptide modification chaperone [Staphylococcus aureus]HDP5870760.1 PqqD family peptide modification chaperone [Staphylococcus aureus]HDP5926206.1 PqqD family peptide modification chaperone [Staphylococcus aureus]HDP6029066.1 PqqD family peptide modification chaperone [Staphylococcus aureus]HDP6109926.1 PqqD family peptide modification chaperone [Staphylococcus aureus]
MRLKENIVLQDKGYSGILFDTISEDFFELDQIGIYILKYLTGKKEYQEKILSEYDIQRDELNLEIINFKNVLLEKEIIEND